MVVLVPGAGLRSAVSFSRRARLGFGGRVLRGRYCSGGGLLRRVRDQPARVVGDGGVGVEGAGGKVGAAVAEVVFLPLPAGHPVDDAGGGQVAGRAGGQDVHLAAGVAAVRLAASDLPQLQHAARVPALADGQLHCGVGEVVLVLAAVVSGPAGRGEGFAGRAGASLPVSFLR